MFLQNLWYLEPDWNAALPQDLHTKWVTFREALKELNNIKFPRHVFSQQVPTSVQIHIFTDASEKAYGAAAYIRSTSKNNIVVVRLLCAKSRVAPMNQLTLPRLELSAAKLGAELGNRVKRDLQLKEAIFYFWTDSEIVLSWINSTSSGFQTFVANRISSIQQLTAAQQWRHVPSKENPADILSRGISPEKLENCNMWFYGPTFLHGSESLWPKPFMKRKDIDMERKRTSLAITSQHQEPNFLRNIDHKNSFAKLQRIIAYILRFINKIAHKNKSVSTSTSLTSHELNEANLWIIKTMQEEELGEDLNHIRRFKEASKTSQLNSLAPFLDDHGVLRVGGRLEAANISYNAKHPILLPYSHPFTKLILHDIHIQNYHAGPQTILSIARQTYWPVKGKTIARSVVQNCVRCARARPKMFSQIMGNLPTHRVQPARPFLNSGVDFCGPLWTHFKIRGKRPQKSYIAVFCCFSTKAVHLELVTDLSTQGFLGALRRFMARRGHCNNIYCDNATNFVGARNELQELKESISSEASRNKIQTLCTSKGADFHFIPPRAPHFGGLWEAAVKSAKHLLQRTLGNASLTYEELETVIIEVEGILNSRPITPLSSDPNDITALTPGHFLIGEPLTNSVDPNAKPLNASIITRWKLVSHLKNEFWRRWSNEYLNHLQHRYKWKHQCENVRPGTMVIIKEENRPPLKWPLGRIVQTYKGNDNMVRVADIRTATGIIRRAIHKLAPLPIIDQEESDETQSGTSKNQQPAARIVQPDEPNIILCRTQSKRPNSSNEERQVSADQGKNEEPFLNSDAPRKKNRLSMSSVLMCVLLACSMMPITKASSVEIRPFQTVPGIYFENMGTVNIFTNEWNLIAYYDMNPYWQEFASFKNYSTSLTNLCNLMDDRHVCSKIAQHLQHTSEELAQNNNLLIPMSSRSKRGAFNIIGTMANALFGVLDSNYAEEMSTIIDGLHENEDHMHQLMHHVMDQTSIIDATINVMKRDQEAVRNHFQELQTHIEQITKHISDIDQLLYQERVTQLFLQVAMQAMLIASRLQEVQASILTVLIDTHHGQINPQLIPPAQLQAELVAIKGHLPPSLRLPIQGNDIIQVYNLMTIEGRTTSKHIIFRLKLPLLNSEEFELFQVVPVPTRVKNNLLAIRPSSQYLVVNFHRDQYYQLNKDELDLCVSTSPGAWLCKQGRPLYHKGAPASACEIKLLNNIPPSNSCEVMKAENGPHWIQLHNPNHWIYVLEEKTTLNIVCGDNITQRIIDGSGTLKISSGCIIKQPSITIQGHNVFSSVTRLSYIPMENLTSLVPPSQLELALSHTSRYQPHLKELEVIKTQIQQMNNELPARIKPHDVHQFAVGYIGLFLVLTILTYFVWRIIPIQCKNRRKPKPSPRQHIQTTTNSQPAGQLSELNFDVDFNVE